MNDLRYFFLLLILASALPLSAQFAETGYATYYADYLAGRPTAYGETYLPDQFTAAHPKHPLNTLIKVTRIDDGRSVTVRVNDKGPFKAGYIVDLSDVAGKYIGLDIDGKAKVRVEVVGYSEINPVPDDYVRQVDLIAEGYSAPTTYGESNLPSSFSTKGLAAADAGNYNPAEPIRRLKDNIGGYGIQLASYTVKANAERQVRSLQAQGIKDIYIKEKASSYSDEVLYKIIVARFADKEQAEQQLKLLRRQKGVNGFVTLL
ncbi:MAG TPA: septal ring lytic transglycosylase RlpA family protein [Saprospiraceae bacterium]|nr:septal ring lytic transglycosylase RlpA family protein [Saprospiraceae bacterium]